MRMVTLAELWELEDVVVAVGRGLTAELHKDGSGGAAIRFESITGASAVVQVVAGGGSPVDTAVLCPADLDEHELLADAFVA